MPKSDVRDYVPISYEFRETLGKHKLKSFLICLHRTNFDESTNPFTYKN